MRKAITAITLAAALAITTAAAVPLSAQETNTIWTAPAPAPGEVRCLEYQNTETKEVVSNRDGGGVYVSGDGIELTDIGIRNWLAACNTAAKAVGSNQRYVRCADGYFEADTLTYDGDGMVQNENFADCEHYVISPPQPETDETTALERCIEYNTETNRDLPAPRDANGNPYTLKSIRESCEEILAG